MRNLLGFLPVVSALLFAALCAPSILSAQAFEVGGGYTYVHSNIPPGGCGCFSMNGGDAWAAFNLAPRFAVVGEFGVQHGSNIASTAGDLTLMSYMAGPRYTLHHVGRFHPFAQALVGGAHASGAEAPGTNGLPGSANAFAASVGGGMNFSWREHLSFRLIQADYYFTKFDNGMNDHQNNFRIGAGVFLRF